MSLMYVLLVYSSYYCYPFQIIDTNKSFSEILKQELLRSECFMLLEYLFLYFSLMVISA